MRKIGKSQGAQQVVISLVVARDRERKQTTVISIVNCNQSSCSKMRLKSTYPNRGRGIRWWHWLFTARGRFWSRHIWLRFWNFCACCHFLIRQKQAKTADGEKKGAFCCLCCRSWGLISFVKKVKTNSEKYFRTSARCA